MGKAKKLKILRRVVKGMNPDASPLALKREYKRVKKLGVINGLHKSLQKGGQ